MILKLIKKIEKRQDPGNLNLIGAIIILNLLYLIKDYSRDNSIILLIKVVTSMLD